MAAPASSVYIGWLGTIRFESSSAGAIFPVPSTFMDGSTSILAITSTAVTSTVPGLWPDGSQAAPSLAAKDNTDTGINFAASSIRATVDGTYYWGQFADQFQLKSTSTLDWSSGNVGVASDVSLSRGAANRLDLATGDSFNIVSGSVLFNVTDATIGMESSGLKLVANGVGLNVGSAIAGTTWNFTSTAILPIGAQDLGATANSMRRMYLAEATAPSAPAANEVVIYAVDNGAGKTQLMALFSSGASQQLAIQP